MNDFLIIIPPYIIDNSGLAIIPNKAMLPVGPLSIASGLIKKRQNVKVVDLVFETNWKEKLSLDFSSVPHILLSCHTIRNITPCKLVFEEIRKKRFKGHITLGGNACIELNKNNFFALGLEVDTVIKGYSHGLIEEIISKAEGDLSPSKEEIKSELLPPACNLLNKETLKKYLYYSKGRYPLIGHGYGCSFDCSYCTADMNSRWVERSIDEILPEINIAKKLGYNHLWCVDNLISLNPERTIVFDKIVSKENLTWSGMDRAEIIIKKPNLLKNLKSLKGLAMGIETTSEKQLKIFKRTISSEVYPRAFKLAKEAGIASTAFVILDCPETDESDFWELYNYLNNEIKPSSVSISFYNPPAYKGLFELDLRPTDFGFYKWPLGFSNTRKIRTVQQAMSICGTWWLGWKLNMGSPFFENDFEVGVNFQEGKILQKPSARSPTGDIWEMWIKRIKRSLIKDKKESKNENNKSKYKIA